MKIAVVTDDHHTISAHFGRATFYEIFLIEHGEVVEQHALPKSNHRHANLEEPHEENHQHNHDHSAMMESILDCDVLITRGMGTGAYNALKLRSIEPIITDIQEIENAVKAYMDGTIIDHPERLH